MGVLQRFERRLEGMVGLAFARIFKGKVHPAEIAKALQREATEQRKVMGEGRVLVPNVYEVRLGPADHDNLAEWSEQLAAELADMVAEHVEDEGFQTFGDITVRLERDDDLHTVSSRSPRTSPTPAPTARPGTAPTCPTTGAAPSPASTPPRPCPQPAAARRCRRSPRCGAARAPRPPWWAARVSAPGSPTCSSSTARAPARAVGGQQRDRARHRGRHPAARHRRQPQARRRRARGSGRGRAGPRLHQRHAGERPPVGRQPLSDGDVIRIGHSVLVYRQDGA